MTLKDNLIFFFLDLYLIYVVLSEFFCEIACNY